MEDYHDSSSDKDAKLKRSFESYQSTEEDGEKKKKQKKKKAEAERAEKEKRSKEKSSEESWRDEKTTEKENKPASFIGALLGEEPARLETSTVASDKEAKDKDITTPEGTSSAETVVKTELSPDEQREAAVAYVAEREARLAAEAAQAEQLHDVAAAEEVVANQSFLQRLKTKLLGEQFGDRPTSELLDEAADETVNELDAEIVSQTEPADEVEIPEPESVNVEPDQFIEGLDADDQELTGQQQAVTTATSTTIPPPPPVSPVSGSNGGFGGGAGPLPPGGMFSPGVGLGGSANREFTAPAAVASETASFTERAARRNTGAGEFLLGAFVGYLFGRRRGRIKAEAEHEPVKKQLEQEVKQLQTEIEVREDRVRSAVRRVSPEVQPATTQTGETATAHQTEVNSSEQHTATEKLTSTEQKPESIAAQRVVETEEGVAPAAVVGLESVVSNRAKAVETITTPNSALEQRAETTAAHTITKESIATMPLPEVLERARQISYHGETLRDMYRADKIDEKTLRESIQAFYGGEQYEQRLERGLRQLQEAAISAEALEQQRFGVEQSAAQQATTGASTQSLAAISQEQDTSIPSEPFAPTTTRENQADLHGGLTPMRQATIGAAIGIAFVVIIVLFFSFR